MSVALTIKKACNDFLLFLDVHAVGILATIIIHLFLIVLFLLIQISSLKRKEEVYYVDLSVLTPVEEQNMPTPLELSASAPLTSSSPQNAYRDIPVNESRAERSANQNIQKMVDDIKSELNVKDMKISDPEDLPADPDPEESTQETDRLYEEQYPVDRNGARTIYDGPTHVSYVLKDRTHTRMRVPAYKCRGSGKIVVDIVVNQRGYVVTATVNKALSTTEDACFVQAAQTEAERSRFNANLHAPEKQAGSITYLFEAQ